MGPPVTPSRMTGPPQHKPRRVAAQVRSRLRRALRAVADELASRWLEVAGAIVLVASVIGFVAFARPELEPGARWAATGAVPMVLIIVAVVLRRSGARLAGSAAEVAAGAALVVVGIGAVADLLSPAAPAWAMPLGAAAVAGTGSVLAAASRRWGSVLAHLAAPLSWAAAGCVGSATGLATGGGMAWGGPAAALAAVAFLARGALRDRSAGSPAAGRPAWSTMVEEATHRGIRRGQAATALAAIAASHVTGLVLAAAEGFPPGPIVASTVVAVAGALVAAGRLRLPPLGRTMLALGAAWSGAAALVPAWGTDAGWAISMAALCVAATEATRWVGDGPQATVARIIGITSGLLAWRSGIAALDLPTLRALSVTAVGAATLVAAAGLVAHLDPDRLRAASRAAVAGGLTIIAVAVATTDQPAAWDLFEAGRVGPALVTCVLAAIGTAALAGPLRNDGLRAAASLLVIASASLLAGWTVVDLDATLVLATASVAATGVALSQRDWRATAGATATVLGVAALVPAAMALPARGPLVAVLVLAAVQLGAVSAVTRRAAPAMAAPFPATLAWIVLATGPVGLGTAAALTGAGVALCIEAAVLEVVARRRGDAAGAPLPRAIAALDIVGVGALAAPGLAELWAGSLGWAVVVAAAGSSVAAWGAATKVRRRMVLGSVAGGAALVSVLVVPLIRILPEVGAVALWGALGALGAVLLGAGALIERRGRIGN